MTGDEQVTSTPTSQVSKGNAGPRINLVRQHSARKANFQDIHSLNKEKEKQVFLLGIFLSNRVTVQKDNQQTQGLGLETRSWHDLQLQKQLHGSVLCDQGLLHAPLAFQFILEPQAWGGGGLLQEALTMMCP